jgi:hypothetical protein
MSPPLFLVLSQINPGYTTPAYLSKIHFNIILPPISRSSNWSLSFKPTIWKEILDEVSNPGYATDLGGPASRSSNDHV